MEYQSKVGSLDFASNQTRPDVAFATGYVARYACSPTKAHINAVNRVFSYLKNDPEKGILYSGKHGLQLKGFVDGDSAGCEDSRRYTTGQVFTLAGGTSILVLLRGKKQWPDPHWMQNTLPVRKLQKKPCGLEISSTIFAFREYTSTQPRYTLTTTQPLKLTRNPESHSR